MNEDLSKAAADVLAERDRQKAVEGWTSDHDDKHDDGELANAAACYAIQPHGWALPRQSLTQSDVEGIINRVWPWWGEHDNGDRIYWRGKMWFKPTNRRRDLVKAGALILAEIERLDRAALSKAKGPTT